MKKTEKNVTGTSYYGYDLTATPAQLIKILGEPTYENNGCGDKVNMEWVCETTDGRIITIYDWKEYRQIQIDEPITWHLGGMQRIDTLVAKAELSHLLLNRTINTIVEERLQIFRTINTIAENIEEIKENLNLN